METNEKLAALRASMKKCQLHAYLIFTEDPHQSEYSANRFKSRAYFSGFLGSAGVLAVLEDKSALWTDGRYFTQAEKELAGSEILLMRAGLEETPELFDWLLEQLPAGSVLGFDGRQINLEQQERALRLFKAKDIALQSSFDLAEEAWPQRPALPKQEIKAYSEALAGKSAQEKITLLVEQAARAGADSYFAASLDDIAWIVNLRGSDVQDTPIFYAYLWMSRKKNILFVETAALSSEAAAYLKKNNIETASYEKAEEILASLSGHAVYICPERVNALCAGLLARNNRLVLGRELSAYAKAVKNAVELEAIRKIYIHDGAAMVRALSWLEEHAESASEWDMHQKLIEERSKEAGFCGPSFNSIVAQGPHGAMMHYAPGKDPQNKAAARGFTVIDSGGQYWGATTDITRTFPYGRLTDEEKTDYTLTLKSHIALASQPFLSGATGAQLDGIARSVMWKRRMDYKSGTGHGVGAMLSVHEGPQAIKPLSSIRWQAGMIGSIEPGVYKTGKYGIRLENIYEAVKLESNDDGSFLAFKTLTYCPFYTSPLKKELLTVEEIEWLNAYHAKTYKLLSPLLKHKALELLARETAPI